MVADSVLVSTVGAVAVAGTGCDADGGGSMERRRLVAPAGLSVDSENPGDIA